ncbi:MAG: AraC-like DNA-binding protein [Cyclobacteriaceae bacterium]|jgi:AraC-like DNA-binding protein
MYDVNTISYKGVPLFQTAKVMAPSSSSASLDGVACFFYVLNGSFTTVQANGPHRIQEKEGLIKNNCGNFISQFKPGKNGNYYEAVVTYLYPDVFKEIYNNEVPSFFNTEIAGTPKKLVGDHLLEEFIKGLTIYFQNHELIDDDLVQLKLKELVMILLKSKYYESVHQLFNTIFATGKHEFRTVVENNLYSPINMDEIAFLANKSLSTFKRDFKKEFDETPSRYIKRRRLERAAQLLLATDELVSRVGYDCGFQDATTFSTSFLEHFGSSPSKYRVNQIRK